MITGFKGPNLPPDKFRELFAKVFGIKLSFPEVGILLHIIDTGGSLTVGGTRFLNWFYRVSRHAEKFLLEESNEPLSMEILKSSASLHSRGGGQSSINGVDDDYDDAADESLRLSSATKTNRPGTKPSRSSSSIPAAATAIRSPTRMKSRGDAAISRSELDGKYEYFKEYNNNESKMLAENNNVPYEVHNSQSFIQSTLNKKWFLPSITFDNNDDDDDQSMEDFNDRGSSEDKNGEYVPDNSLDGYRRALSYYSLSWYGDCCNVLCCASITYCIGESIRMHLASLFSSDLEEPQHQQTTDKSSIGSSSLSSRGYFGASLQSITSQISTLTESESQLLMRRTTSTIRRRRNMKSSSSSIVSTTPSSKKRFATETLTIIPGQIRLKLMNESSNNNSSSHDQHSVFLSDLFESETPSMIKFPDRFPTSTSRKTYPPLEQISKLNHDLKESPMALTQRKFQQSRGRSRRDDKRKGGDIDERVRDVLSIPVIMSPTRPALTGGPPLKATAAAKDDASTTDHHITTKEGEDSSSSSNFYFPAVLMASCQS